MKTEQVTSVYNDNYQVIGTIEIDRFYPNENAVAGYTYEELTFIANAMERKFHEDAIKICDKAE